MDFSRMKSKFQGEGPRVPGFADSHFKMPLKVMVFDAAARIFFERATVCLGGAYAKPLTVYPAGKKPVFPRLARRSGYEAEVRAFLALVNGRASVGFSASDARASLKLVLAELKAAENGLNSCTCAFAGCAV